jgi:hypothetical protein
MLASDAHEKYTQEDMTFDSLASINMDRTFLKRYGIISIALVIIRPIQTCGCSLHQKSLQHALQSTNLCQCRQPRGRSYRLTSCSLNSNLDMLRSVFSSVSRVATWLYDRLNPLLFITPYKGSLTSLYVATAPEIRVQNLRGMYFNPIAKVGEVHQFAKDDRRAEALWNLSESLLKERGFEVPSV